MQQVRGTNWLKPRVIDGISVLEGKVQQPMVRPIQGTALQGSASHATASEAPAGAARGSARWPEERVMAVESLWGTGYVSPGGATETLRLSKPLGLTGNSTLLLLGGGLGGPALTITQSFKAWVSSFEADPVLAAAAEERRSSVDRAGRVSIGEWERERPRFKPRSANHALALEAMRGAPPLPIIKSLAAALRPQAQIVMTELVAENPAPPGDREFGAWCRLEDRQPSLPRLSDISTALEGQKFDVRVVEDISERHVSQTLEGWRAAVKAMEAGVRPAAAAAAAFVNEAELWLLRLRLMRRLDLKLIRWHALSP
jgi:cyclopropane fatty-acyl-phospholipid synthase-like methyltransferase